MAEPVQTDPAGSGQATGDGALAIAEVSELLSIPVDTIRSWERRYSLPGPARTAGGHRRYDEVAIRRLRAIRDQISRGFTASKAIEAIERAGPGPEHEPAIQAILAAADAGDPLAVRSALDDARAEHGLAETIRRVLLPAMRDVGWRWQAGRCDVGTEHLVTDAARAWLTRFRLVDQPRDRGSWVVLACGPRDYHTVGLEGVAAILGERGWNCHVLGAVTPAPALVSAARIPGTLALALLSHMQINRRAAAEALSEVATNAPDVALFYAGNAFVSARSRRHVRGTYLGEDIVEGADMIETALRASACARR